MPLETTLGQLLINEALPEDLRNHARVFDKKGLNDVLHQVALKHPEQYRDVSKKLADVGRRSATASGGNSFGLAHMRKAQSSRRIAQEIQTKLARVLNRDDLSDEQRRDLVVRTVGSYQDRQMEEVLKESLEEKNPLALQILSGSRGNKMNLSSLRGSDMLYADHHDEVIPLPVLRSYSQGLTPAEYWAGSYGARRGIMATKFATQDAGYLSKQLNQVSHRLLVADVDQDGVPDTPRGLPVDVDDMDNEGSLLAQGVGPYKRNTVLTPKILKDIKARGHPRLLVRSPLVGGSPEGGVYARDVGVRERGTLPGRGEMVGLLAAQALSEPLSQAQLAAKHSGGVAGQEKALGGFSAINQLIQTPKAFKGGAAHTEVDGRVENVEDAPAGGQYVTVAGQRHYVAKGFELKVKKGDEVEAGDVLSEGFPNPAVVVQHKGHGEGRRYFVDAMKQAFAGAGIRVHRRNLELLSRGLINHVRLTEETDHHVPDDVVPYSTLEHTYSPREDSLQDHPKRLLNHYLEKPVLHYSIGTKIRPSVLKNLEEFGVDKIQAHPEPPPFQPEMIRGMASLQHDPDWMTRMYGSGLKGSLLEATHRGASSTELGSSFVPGLARAVDFGRVGMVRSPEPGLKIEEAERYSVNEPAAKTTDVKPGRPAPTPSASPQEDLKPPKKKSILAGLFKFSSQKRAADPTRPRTGQQSKTTQGNPQPPASLQQPQTQGQTQQAPAKDDTSYVSGSGSNDLPPAGQEGQQGGSGASTQDVLANQYQDPNAFNQQQNVAAQWMSSMGINPYDQGYGGYGGQGYGGYGYGQGYGQGYPPPGGAHPQGGVMPGQPQGQQQGQFNWTGWGGGGDGAQGGQQQATAEPQDPRSWGRRWTDRGMAAAEGVQHTANAMWAGARPTAALTRWGSYAMTGGRQATDAILKVKELTRLQQLAAKSGDLARAAMHADNLATATKSLEALQAGGKVGPGAARAAGVVSKIRGAGRFLGRASPWIGIGLGALEAGVGATGVMDKYDTEWDEWKKRHAETGSGGQNDILSFDPEATGWARYKKKQQMKFFNDMNPDRIIPWNKSSWKGWGDNPIIAALGNVDKVYNPVGTWAATQATLDDATRIGKHTTGMLADNIVSSDRNRRNEGVTNKSREDAIAQLHQQQNEKGLTEVQKQDLANQERRAKTTADVRETEHLNVPETAIHNVTTKPMQSGVGLVAAHSPLGWVGSEISGATTGNYAMNPLTSRRARVWNAGGLLPWD